MQNTDGRLLQRDTMHCGIWFGYVNQWSTGLYVDNKLKGNYAVTFVVFLRLYHSINIQVQELTTFIYLHLYINTIITQDKLGKASTDLAFVFILICVFPIHIPMMDQSKESGTVP